MNTDDLPPCKCGANLERAVKRALIVMRSSRIFVTTRERINQDFGTEWYDNEISALQTAADEWRRMHSGDKDD
ncbi:MAG: hypothetical protein KDA17_05190 [Candidatus Saccharibacteria bacterium]|nr:hypothetical protein [Candidatus Saccharibacteria bacterium]